MISGHQAVEVFHLHFVLLLCGGPSKGRLAIHGDCNLRFFFGSVRYSEDIDLDVSEIPVHVLRDKVAAILGGPALAMSLRSRGITVTNVSAPKQTETTQRWKVGLSLQGQAAPLHTKIEFSRRPTVEEAKVEAVDAGVLAEHQLMPVLLPHYPLGPALRQKVGALAGRAVVQARDVFDLAVLFARTGGDLGALKPVHSILPAAIERAMDVSYEDFRSQVLSYLKPEYLERYGSPEAWDTLQMHVVDMLQRAS